MIFSSCQSSWQRNLVCCHLLGSWCGVSDHEFSKYDGKEAIVFFTLLHSFAYVFGLVTGIGYLIFLCSICNFHEHHQICTGSKSYDPTSLAETYGKGKNGIHCCLAGAGLSQRCGAVPDCRVWQFPTRSRVCKSKISIKCASVQFDLSVHFKCARNI